MYGVLKVLLLQINSYTAHMSIYFINDTLSVHYTNFN